MTEPSSSHLAVSVLESASPGRSPPCSYIPISNRDKQPLPPALKPSSVAPLPVQTRHAAPRRVHSPGKDRKLLSEPVIQHLFRDGERPMQSVQRDTPEENVGESGGILLWAVWEERGQPELVRLGETGNEEHK
jgi:hypothetical protein